MSGCSSCSKTSTCSTSEKASCGIEIGYKSGVKKVIGIMSGKGGVGKSTVSVNLAKTLRKMGYNVGILDADITGPSIPKMMGLDGVLLSTTDSSIEPAVSEDGIKVVSINLLLDDENTPVIWRGPMVANVVKQLWSDTQWGNLNYLLIDMPPGTGDVPLTVFQSLPVDGVVTVAIPNSVVSMVVSKSLSMASTMGIKNIGIVNNMSYLKCGSCDEKISIFNSESDDARDHIDGVRIIGRLPMIQQILDDDELFDGDYGQEMALIARTVIKEA
jgi:Mrp family chromosome partitioning ATPase